MVAEDVANEVEQKQTNLEKQNRLCMSSERG
jgi:hypothetical protein